MSDTTRIIPTTHTVNVARVRELNDELRAGLAASSADHRNRRIVLAAGVHALVRAQETMYERMSMTARILRCVRDYADWGSDPYGEHDMGGFTFEGETMLFKIDYYDLDMEFGSERPDDPTCTVRVLTIMLASEY